MERAVAQHDAGVKTRPLTPKQQRFVEEYLVDLNATQAAIRAGYSQRNADKIGSQLLGKARVAEAVAAAQSRRAKRVEIDADWVLERLRQNVERAMQAEPVLDREGNPTGEYTYQGAVANRALELLGKHQGMFTDRVQVAGDAHAPLLVELTHRIVDPAT
jgi:phage terminase small subunit